ncbi:MAG: hypothetical protein ACOYYJ_17555 [Chloroflexota bacterium]
MSISFIIGFLFTVLILSYLWGDNFLFRAAIYVFVGIAVGYAVAVASRQVIWPLLVQPFTSGSAFSNPVVAARVVVPLLGSALLLTKIAPRLSGLGQLPMAYLVGVGAAVAIGGALSGTLIPQSNATISAFDMRAAAARGINFVPALLNGGVILLGVVSVLAYFHFGARRKADGAVRRNAFIEGLAWIGRIYIAITFGLLFAGVYMAALTALVERVSSLRVLIDLIGQFF